MQKRKLGQSGVEVTPVIFGAWAIGGWMWGGSDEKEAVEAIRKSIDLGVDTIDTAAIYGMGLSERLVAKAVKGRRDKVVIATKCGMRWDSNEGSDPWPQKDNEGRDVIIRKNSKPDSIIYECEQSLKRLETDYIDLYQIHWPDSSTPIEDSWAAMVKLKEQGKVRAIGVSNYNVAEMKRAHKSHPIASNQIPYSAVRRKIEKETIPFCQKEKIGVIVYSPLERGLLTGAVTMDREFAEGDHRRNHPLYTKENRKKVLEALDSIRTIAQGHKATLTQVMINWTANQPGITAALVGARNVKQAEENAKAMQFVLSKDEMGHIRSLFGELA